MLPRLVLPVLLLIAVTSLLWLSYGFASTYHLFGSAALASVFRAAAAVSTAIVFVVIMANLAVRVGFATLLQYEPTQLQRGLVVAVSIFIAAAVALAYLGVDVGTILTTSALMTAIIGLSVQPLLGSLLAGLTLHRVLRIGDGVLLDGEQVEISSLNWRSVVAKRPDGSALVVPNARLTDSTLQILAHDHPLRAAVVLELPATIAPHRVRKLISDIIDDFPEVDSTEPVSVLPQKAAGTNPLTSYRATFWVSRYADRADIEGRVLRRAWYAFRREGLFTHDPASPLREAGAEAEEVASAVTVALLTARSPVTEASEAQVKSIVAEGEILVYDDGERIVLPERHTGCFCVLIDGELAEIGPAPAAPGVNRIAQSGVGVEHELTRTAALAKIERALTARIGPYAGYAVARASASGASLNVVCADVAEEIDDPGQRQEFMLEANPPIQRLWQPGILLTCHRDASRRLVVQPSMRAVDHALILAGPIALLGSHAPGAGAT